MRRSVEPEPPFEWDWIYVVLIVLVLVVVLAATFELWAPHGDLHRDGAVRMPADQGVVAIVRMCAVPSTFATLPGVSGFSESPATTETWRH